MTDGGRRRVRAGDRVEDHCRACKMAREHTVVVADPGGAPLRVLCDTCGSLHDYRGGAREPDSRPAPAFVERFERERSTVAMTESSGESGELERLLRRVIREESGLTPVAPAAKWRGGEMVLRAGRPGVQDKSWPIDTFFHKVVMLRNRLRVLEQNINAADIPDDLKVKLQSYVTGCYGTLTSFNVLFADDADRFRGSGE